MTGHIGLIGSRLIAALARAGVEAAGVDLRCPTAPLDVRAPDVLAPWLPRLTGVIHLAAISRVIHGQKDPVGCRTTNVGGTRSLLQALMHARQKPFVILASSREVYGQQGRFPVREDAPLRPMNIYARSKVAAERLANAAQETGLRTAIVRFSSVYGDPSDHPDRVVPAFCRAALADGVLRVDGRHTALDLTHVDDVVDGLARMIDMLGAGERSMPPIHLVSGRLTRLVDLAGLIRALAHGGRVMVTEPRSYDVGHFWGDPTRAAALLGWRSSIALETGLPRLIADLGQRGVARTFSP